MYVYDSDAREHARAREWWERTLTQSRPVGMPWITALGFIRISWVNLGFCGAGNSARSRLSAGLAA